MTNRKSPRAFKIDTYKTASPLHRIDNCVRSYDNFQTTGKKAQGVEMNKIGFVGAAKTENDANSVENLYREVLRQIGLLSDIDVLGFQKAFDCSSRQDQDFLNNIKGQNIDELKTSLTKKREDLVQKLHINC